jgi:hypothetical protein
MSIDPKAFVVGFDSMWNAGDRDGILAAVDDGSVVELSPDPPPPDRARYVGQREIAEFVDTFIKGFHVDSRDFRVDRGAIVWESDVSNDVFRAAGLDPASGTSRAEYWTRAAC